MTNSMSFKAYYDELKNAPINFREEIMDMLGISRRTFFIRMKENSWTDQEKRLIAQHMGESTDVLFPEIAESYV